jgi:S1-C subfamily serine protease
MFARLALARSALLLLPAFAAMSVHAAIPADSTRVLRVSTEEAFFLPEIATLVTAEGKDLKIQMAPPAGQLREPYRSVDVKTGDMVLLANGKRVKTIADLKRTYEATAIGAEFALGLQRGQELMIAAYPKADSEALPKRTMRIVTSDAPGTEVFPAVGVALTEKERRVSVSQLLPVEKSAVHGLDVKEGDVIGSMNGKPVTSLQAFVTAYDALKVGTAVVWELRREGNTVSVTFAKPQPAGQVIIRQEVK